MSKDELSDLFLNEKPVRALIAVKHQSEPYGSSINGFTGTTYAHCTKILAKLEGHGLVHGEKRGRKKMYSLTEKGRRITDILEKACVEIDASFVEDIEAGGNGQKIGEVISRE